MAKPTKFLVATDSRFPLTIALDQAFATGKISPEVLAIRKKELVELVSEAARIGNEKRRSVLQTAASALHRTAARRFEGLCALPNRIGRMNLTWQGRSGMKPKPALRSSGDCNQSPGTRGAKQSVEVPYGSVGATKLRSREMLTQC